jgi:hypothetical protein
MFFQVSSDWKTPFSDIILDGYSISGCKHRTERMDGSFFVDFWFRGGAATLPSPIAFSKVV